MPSEALTERPLEVVLDDYADDGGDEELGSAAKAKASAARNASELDAAVRRIGERDMARRPGHDPTVRVRHVDPAELKAPPADNAECADCGVTFLPGEGRWRDAGRHSLLVHSNGGRAARPPEQSADTPSESSAVASWRDEEITDWLRGEGEATAGQIREHFGFPKGSQQGIIARLRTRGLIERTGKSYQGPSGGRPAPLFRAAEPGETSHAQTGADEAEQPADDPAPGDAAAETPDPLTSAYDEGAAAAVREDAAPDQSDGSTVSAARGVESPAPTDHPSPPEGDTGVTTTRAADMSVHEQLVVRYIGALISSIERATILRDAGPPEHVYDRIERLLEIQEGVA